MAKHRLIISKDINGSYPVRSEAGQFKVVRTLVVHWKGAWAPEDRPELYLVVAPGDELEFALASEKDPGGSVWLFKRLHPLLPQATQRQETWERVDVEHGSQVLQVNHALAQDAGESRYDLRISALGQRPLPIVGQGQAGSLTATKP